MFEDLKALLHGSVSRIAGWLIKPGFDRVVRLLAVILIGSGVYGFTLGIWRAPLQSNQ